jgi:hypothetical protein
MRISFALFILSLLAAAACTATQPPLENQHDGVAELRMTTDPKFAGLITRVTVETSEASADLTPGGVTPGTFAGTLALSSGPHSLVVRAFSNETVIGASNPIAVEITSGVVTRVMARILDLTVDSPVFGPLFDSLTAPSTIPVGEPAAFTISVIAPAGAPVTYTWSSDCADSTFSAPSAASTRWSTSSPGSCTITVVASSNGFSITQTFVIVVAGPNDGAVDVWGEFISAPPVQLTLGSLGCSNGSRGAENASCPAVIAAPGGTSFSLNVAGWGFSTPGALELTDNCGGRIEEDARFSDSLFGFWIPPVQGGVCVLTARAVNSDGVAGTTSIALLTRAGTAAPRIFAQLGGCTLLRRFAPPAICPPIFPGMSNTLTGSVEWAPGNPGRVTVTDSCASVPFDLNDNPFSLSWAPFGGPGTVCLVQVTASDPQGFSSTILAQYSL